MTLWPRNGAAPARPDQAAFATAERGCWGLAEYRPNPSHRRSKLLACTEAGYWAVRQISLLQHPWAARVGAAIGADELETALGTIQRLSTELADACSAP